MFNYMFNYWVIDRFISRRSGSSGQGERGQVCSVQCMSVARTLKTGLQNCVAAAGERKQRMRVQCHPGGRFGGGQASGARRRRAR